MNKVVFIGAFTPMQKVLYAFKQIKGLDCLAIYTNSTDSVVKKYADDLNIKVCDIDMLKMVQGRDELKKLEPDWIFNINTTFIFSKDILSVPRFGSLNLHPGRLPEYAGLHVHQWAIRNGEDSFAMTIHWMEEAVDAGPIAYAQEFPISQEDTGLSLFMKCMNAGAEVILKALKDIRRGKMPPRVPQDLSRRKLYLDRDSKDGAISWEWSSAQIHNFIRAADYYPLQSPTYVPTCILRDERKINILKAKQSTDSSEHAGEITKIGDDGVVIGTCDGLSLLITRIRNEDNKVIQGKSIAQYFNCEVGEKIIKT